MKTRISNKFLTLLLTLCMVVTLIPLTAFATDTPINSVAITCQDFGKPSDGIEVGSTAYGASAFSNDPAGAWTVTDLDDGNGGAQKLVVSTVLPAKQAGEQPTQGNSYEIALDNVIEGGTLSEDLGSVQYAVESDTSSGVRPVDLNVDYDGAEDGVALTVGNTGGENPKVKYTYTVKDTEKQFKLYVIPAKNKTATITKDVQGNMQVVDKISWKPGTAPMLHRLSTQHRYSSTTGSITISPMKSSRELIWELFSIQLTAESTGMNLVRNK